MEKVTIKNRNGKNLVVVFEKLNNPKGLTIVFHGLGGTKDQPHILTFADSFKEKGYTTLRFDVANTFGESEGNYEDATTTNYYQDLEDVLIWAKSQTWYQEPFILVGHSLGSMCILLYAENHPKLVKALAPISAVVSGKLSLEADSNKKVAKEWESSGWRVQESVSEPGRIKRLPWSHMVDRLKYDVLPKVNKLTMPVLLIVGDRDDSTPTEHQQLLFDKLPGKKEIHIIKNAPHTFVKNDQLAEIKQIFLSWISSLN